MKELAKLNILVIAFAITGCLSPTENEKSKSGHHQEGGVDSGGGNGLQTPQAIVLKGTHEASKKLITIVKRLEKYWVDSKEVYGSPRSLLGNDQLFYLIAEGSPLSESMLQTAQRITFNVLHTGLCPSAHGPAAASAHPSGEICLSVEGLQKISPKSFEVEFLALLFHEFAHVRGLVSERDALFLQELFLGHADRIALDFIVGSGFGNGADFFLNDLNIQNNSMRSLVMRELTTGKNDLIDKSKISFCEAWSNIRRDRQDLDLVHQKILTPPVAEALYRKLTNDLHKNKMGLFDSYCRNSVTTDVFEDRKQQWNEFIKASLEYDVQLREVQKEIFDYWHSNELFPTYSYSLKYWLPYSRFDALKYLTFPNQQAPVTQVKDVRCLLKNQKTGSTLELQPRIEDELMVGNGFQFPGGYVKKVILKSKLPLDIGTNQVHEEELAIEFHTKVVNDQGVFVTPSDLKMEIHLSQKPASNQAHHFSHKSSTNLYTLNGTSYGILQRSMIEALEFNFKIAFFQNQAGPFFTDSYQLRCGLDGRENAPASLHPLF